MMRSFTMKYIMVDITPTRIPILFGAQLSHSNMARCVGFPVSSAGFVLVAKDGSIYTYGRSATLSLEPREEDAQLITNYITCNILI